MPEQNVLITLSSLGLLKIQGEGAKKLLQGQLTCDLEQISATQTSLGAHCNPQGRVLSLFRVIFYKNHYFLQMPRELIPAATNALKKYAQFFKVELHDMSDETAQMGYIGQPSADFPSETNQAVTLNNVLVVKVPGDTRYLLLGNTADIATLLQATDTSTENTWKSADIHEGIPTIYAKTSGEFLPHEINLPLINAVSFKKGCFTGQEIIARMEYRGKLKHHLYFATIQSEQAPEIGQDIFREKDTCGTVVDVCQVSYNNYELLVIAPENDVNRIPLALDPDSKVILKF